MFDVTYFALFSIRFQFSYCCWLASSQFDPLPFPSLIFTIKPPHSFAVAEHEEGTRAQTPCRIIVKKKKAPKAKPCRLLRPL